MTIEHDSKILDILDEIIDNGQLEDRLEYDQSLFKSMYNLSDEEAKDLYILVQHRAIADPNSEMPADIYKEYMLESRDMSWEGFTRRQAEAFELLLADMYKYYKNRD